MRGSKLAVAAAPALFVLLWSTGFIGARYGLPYAEPLTFLTVRMAAVVLLFAVIIVVARPQWPNAREVGHSIAAGMLVQVCYLGGVFISMNLGLPAAIAALIPGLQPVLTSTLANRWLGERVSALQWIGLVLGLVGVVLVVEDRISGGTRSLLAWGMITVSLLGITVGTLYQKRFCGSIDLRTGNFIQYVASGLVFGLGAVLFETHEIQWTGEFVFAVIWLAVALSFGAVGLLYHLIRHSAATRVASLFYLTPAVTALMAWLLFNERLGVLSIIGMAVCAIGVLLVNWRRIPAAKNA
jgi:drug/metabolite transporter (DMT)-like permease